MLLVVGGIYRTTRKTGFPPASQLNRTEDCPTKNRTQLKVQRLISYGQGSLLRVVVVVSVKIKVSDDVTSLD